ncbi:MAG: hypothetical protein A2Y38_20755 [Spirochaetes bacterium GWB1_59_5]|nr:MAG: hypothetical protein A2Y38_20755 [Spirochaetes bacterium GWB1_59_5]
MTVLQREPLFSLDYGVLEDELNLFSLDGMAPPQKTRLAMRDGIFFVSNGNAAKVLTLSSFGDLLAMVYNPERNPPPLTLQQSDAGDAASGRVAQGRTAKSYPFTSPGEIAVDSKRTIFVEDRVPDSRRSYDDAMNASLEYVVLRFSRDGEYLDYLGQEGVGGTPFPLLTGLYITANDDCVVVSLTGSGWTAFRFDARGVLLSTIAVRRDDLPRPPEDVGNIASMDRIVASPDGSGLILKIDYFREVVDVETHTQAGIEFSSSWAWVMDGATGNYIERYELPAFESMIDQKGDELSIPRAWELAGAAAGVIFLSAADDDGSTYYGLFNMDSRAMKRFSLKIEPDETLYAAFSLSPEGILSAILGSRYEARFVWWRFDKMQGGLAP